MALLALAACSGSSDNGAASSSAGSVSGSGGSGAGATITYWASNQGSSLDNDKKVLQPEIDKFTQQTGIKVNLEVVPWSDLTNNTLSAAVSGQGPDVLNIGNTNAATFQSTGAFYPFDDAALQQFGGKQHWVDSAFATAGVAGQPVTSLPLYSQVYALYYNKKMFAAAGLQPPKTWAELVSAAQKLTDASKGVYGVAIPGGTVNVSMHYSFIFGSQNGGAPFDAKGQPTFTSDGMVEGVQQYVDLMGKDKVVNPSLAQDSDNSQAPAAFAQGKAAMYMTQTSGINVLRQNGMDPDAYGIVPIPAPADGTKISSFVAGTNISVFKNTKNLDASLQFVKFMTSDAEQAILNKSYTTIPPVAGLKASFDAAPEQLSVWSDILNNYSKPLPLVSSVQAFQANVGGAVVRLIAQAATGNQVDSDTVKSALSDAQQKMPTS
ncbi:ABC transporter substrate-binding protein [Nakamurella endophytica]|uniref:Sugar ABC transporter substrate-binding protein n=1 Tax=Nakamurella endophytica TaxID=1748367 RepID=A0A917SV16_9ACTN|nr:sugar ABC transporter substrate-binding protein [Nakamurella endophytica]GGL97769.1 sugar ABC transporter substrate-binding protein [Nakamurella endophytica]